MEEVSRSEESLLDGGRDKRRRDNMKKSQFKNEHEKPAVKQAFRSVSEDSQNSLEEQKLLVPEGNGGEPDQGGSSVYKESRSN